MQEMGEVPPAPNEKHLWHGTDNSDDVKNGICDRGFDNRFWQGGGHMVGYGAYFTPSLAKALGYSTGVVFKCKVPAPWLYLLVFEQIVLPGLVWQRGKD